MATDVCGEELLRGEVERKLGEKRETVDRLDLR